MWIMRSRMQTSFSSDLALPCQETASIVRPQKGIAEITGRASGLPGSIVVVHGDGKPGEETTACSYWKSRR